MASGYTTLHARNNPEAPFNLYGRNRSIRVRILSIVLLGGTRDAPRRGATVRFQRSVYDKATGTERPLDSRIATLEYTYKSNLRMDERQRIENPLGFQVTSYRVDNDYAASPPLVLADPDTPEAPVSAMEIEVPAVAPSPTIAPTGTGAAP